MPNVPTIIFECNDWLVLDKPANWHTLRPGKASKTTQDNASGEVVTSVMLPNLEDWVRQEISTSAGLPEGGILHRLDAPTTGCLIVARSAASYERLLPIVRSGSGLTKLYLAVMNHGLPERGEFELYFSSRYRGSRKITVQQAGHPRSRGVCRWRILKFGTRNSPDALAEVELVGPGRRHQIRAGLAHLGYPLRGDALYGGSPHWQGGFGLHAFQVQLEGRPIIAPPPVSWGVAIE